MAADACTLPTAERPVTGGGLVLEVGTATSAARTRAWAERAAMKLAEVEAKITDLAVIAATLRAALEAAVDPAGHTR